MDNQKRRDLEEMVSWLNSKQVQGVDMSWAYTWANQQWDDAYPNDPQPMFGPEARDRRWTGWRAKVSLCECGSGTNRRGPQHSHWCGLHEVYKNV